MDIFDAKFSARWNLLTSILFYRSSNYKSKFAMPLLQFEKEEYSTLNHEISHHWCVKSSELGYFLSYEGAALYEEWKNRTLQGKLYIPERVEQVIAAVTPILEGIALYAQLDYIIDVDDDDIFICPIGITKQFIIPLDYSGTFKEWLFSLRNEAIGSPSDKEKGLLELLFIDTHRHDLNYYFVGYLYIKSIQAFLSKSCSYMSKPEYFLPIIIKIIFDNPVFRECLNSYKSINDIIERIHNYIINLSSKELNYIIELMDMNIEIKQKFYHWDVYKQIENVFDKNLYFYDDEKYLDFFENNKKLDSLSISKTFTILRCSSNTIKLFHYSGILKNVTKDIIQISDIEINIAHFKMIKYRSLDKFIKRLKLIKNKQISLSLIMSLTSGDSVLGIWFRGKLFEFMINAIAYDVNEFYSFIDSPDAIILLLSLGLDPDEAKRFSADIKLSNIAYNIKNSSFCILEKMVSSKKDRETIYNQKFKAFGVDQINNIYNWCYPSPLRRIENENGEILDLRLYFNLPIVDDFPEKAAHRANEIFTFPGFKGSIDFYELLPDLSFK